MDHITKQDAIWLRDTYNKFRNYGRVNQYIDMHIKAMSIIKNKPISKPSCNCEFSAYARMASNMYEQHEAQILEIANKSEVIDERTTQTVPATKKRSTPRSKTSSKQ